MSETSDFFVTGGTLRPTDPSYVTRPADEAFLRHLQAGEFCYVLTPRQMGKSSLMVRTAQRLRVAGVAVVIIDLTRIGSGALAVDQWYLGLLSGLRSGLRLTVEVETWWQAHAALGVAQRFTTFLHDVVLAECLQPVVILIDEIDATLNLPFRDDFFAALRAVYNERAGDPRYNRLTFGLLGVATPTDLIQDRERTPFNIGRRIDLVEFTLADAAPLHSGLAAHAPEQADALLQQIFAWTNGHPYLTQKLCQALVEERRTAAFNPLLPSPSLGEEPSRRDEKMAPSSSLGEEPGYRDEETAPSPSWGGLGWGSEKTAEDLVDALVQKLFLSDEGRKDPNLTFVQDRIASSPPREQRQLLQLYRRVQRGDAVPDDDRSPMQNRLELYGLVGVQQGRLQVRNRIYAQVFNDAWIAAAMPVNPQRRWAALAVLTTFLLTIGIFAWINFRQPTACTVYQEQFTGNQESTFRLDALYRLLLAQDRCGTLALDLFYSVPPAEHEQLFLGIPDLPAARTQLTTVIEGIYRTLDTTPEHDLTLLNIWRTVLQNAGVAENDPLLATIRNWQEGRSRLAAGDAEGAVVALAMALAPNHLAITYDYALALTANGQYTAALTALNNLVKMAPPTLISMPPIEAEEHFKLAPTTVFLTTASYPALQSTPSPTIIPNLKVILPTLELMPTIQPTPVEITGSLITFIAPLVIYSQHFRDSDNIKKLIKEKIQNDQLLFVALQANFVHYQELASILGNFTAKVGLLIEKIEALDCFDVSLFGGCESDPDFLLVIMINNISVETSVYPNQAVIEDSDLKISTTISMSMQLRQSTYIKIEVWDSDTDFVGSNDDQADLDRDGDRALNLTVDVSNCITKKLGAIDGNFETIRKCDESITVEGNENDNVRITFRVVIIPEAMLF